MAEPPRLKGCRPIFFQSAFEWKPIVELPEDARGHFVFLTINKKVMFIADPKSWHIRKYSITHFFELPEVA